jgi:hypothetical protein
MQLTDMGPVRVLLCALRATGSLPNNQKSYNNVPESFIIAVESRAVLMRRATMETESIALVTHLLRKFYEPQILFLFVYKCHSHVLWHELYCYYFSDHTIVFPF